MPSGIAQFDDPIDPHGWALEPTVRRLKLAFPDLEWTLHPTVLVSSWDEYRGPELENGRRGMPATCARLSERSGMPIDEFLWFDDPPTSSTDACRTLAAAESQGPTAGERLLRALREATFVRRTNVSDPEALRSIVAAVPDLDAEAVWAAVDDGTADETLEGHRGAAALDADGVRMAGDRPELPTLVVSDGTTARGISGRRPFGAYRDLVAEVTGLEAREEAPTVEAVAERFSAAGWISTTELAELTGQPYDEARTNAEALCDDGELVERSFASEPFWRRPEYVPDGEA